MYVPCFPTGLIALEKVGLGVQLDMLILQQGGGRFKLIRQTLKFIPLPFGKGAVVASQFRRIWPIREMMETIFLGSPSASTP